MACREKNVGDAWQVSSFKKLCSSCWWIMMDLRKSIWNKTILKLLERYKLKVLFGFDLEATIREGAGLSLYMQSCYSDNHKELHPPRTFVRWQGDTESIEYRVRMSVDQQSCSSSKDVASQYLVSFHWARALVPENIAKLTMLTTGVARSGRWHAL